MAILCEGTHIKKEYDYRLILKDVNFQINQGECIGIVGNNGAGKTTLANIIAGKLSPDEGHIKWRDRGYTIGYLKQSTHYTEEAFYSLVTQHDTKNIQHFLEMSQKLGVDSSMDMHASRLSKLSGGEKTKLALSQIWATNPSILILDEPTNHMDYEGVTWLIEALQKYRGTTILISHDRYFMDKVCHRMMEIEDGIATTYKGNYTTYAKEKQFRYESQLHLYQEQEKYRACLKKDIKQLNDWAAKGHRDSTKKAKSASASKMGLKEKYRARAKKKDKLVKSRIKKLEKAMVEGVDKPKEEQKITFHFNANARHARVLEATDLSVSFQDKRLFTDSSFYIKSGEKVALFGRNGCGKTTLIRLILDEMKPTHGRLQVSPSLKVAYLSQDVGELYMTSTVLEYFSYTNRKEQGVTRTLLTNMGFSLDMLYTKVKDLSVGEKTRLKIASMVLSDNNVLILDEPTNHLDLHTREMLEKTLGDYQGTIIVVSHDRYFLEKLCDKVLYFQEGKIKRSEYDFMSYMKRLEEPVAVGDKNMDNGIEKLEEQRMIIENRITTLLGRLGMLSPDSEEYQQLDDEFQKLILDKKALQ